MLIDNVINFKSKRNQSQNYMFWVLLFTTILILHRFRLLLIVVIIIYFSMLTETTAHIFQPAITWFSCLIEFFWVGTVMLFSVSIYQCNAAYFRVFYCGILLISKVIIYFFKSSQGKWAAISCSCLVAVHLYGLGRVQCIIKYTILQKVISNIAS